MRSTEFFFALADRSGGGDLLRKERYLRWDAAAVCVLAEAVLVALPAWLARLGRGPGALVALLLAAAAHQAQGWQCAAQHRGAMSRQNSISEFAEAD